MHDERLKDMIPSIMESISAFFAPILNTMYSAQIDLYQHLYATVYDYATAQGLTNTDTVVEDCQELYEPIRQRAESEVKSLREGKIAKTPVGESGGKPGIFGGRKLSSSNTSTISKSSSTSAPPPAYSHKPPPPPSGPSPLSSRQNSYAPQADRTLSSSTLGSDAKKKKPPPPPPPKPSLTPKPEFVIAKYDFAGESEGDLALKAGDRIKIIKKTDSLEDWWEGETNGARGMFPRNYCD
jgi:amphiphysin